jgi:hypothetical protein
MYTIQALNPKGKLKNVEKDLELTIAIGKSTDAQLSGKYNAVRIVDQSTGEIVFEIGDFDNH